MNHKIQISKREAVGGGLKIWNPMSVDYLIRPQLDYLLFDTSTPVSNFEDKNGGF